MILSVSATCLAITRGGDIRLLAVTRGCEDAVLSLPLPCVRYEGRPCTSLGPPTYPSQGCAWANFSERSCALETSRRRVTARGRLAPNDLAGCAQPWSVAEALC